MGHHDFSPLAIRHPRLRVGWGAGTWSREAGGGCRWLRQGVACPASIPRESSHFGEGAWTVPTLNFVSLQPGEGDVGN
jgi:hypothetical protein